jgi:hypothetical protein
MALEKLNRLEKKSVLLCEACGGYHPEDDCEIILVKIIKGKKCDLNMTKENTQFNTLKQRTTPQSVIPTNMQTTHAKKQDEIIDEIPVTTQKPVIKSVIPPGVAGVLIPPGHPQFDRLGAKESRRV